MNEPAINIHELKSPSTTLEIEIISEEKNSHSFQLHRHNYWEIFLFKKGSGTHLIDFETSDFKENSVHLIMPAQLHQLASNLYTEAVVLKVSEEFFHASNENKELITELSTHQLNHKTSVIHFDAEEFSALWNIASQMQKEILTGSSEDATILRNYLNIFLYKFRKRLGSHHISPANQSDLALFISFRCFVEKNFQNNTKVHDYLKLLGIRDKKLFSLCSRYIGISPSDYLHKRILIEAKRLLLYSTYCQKEIAYTLNFTDLSHFIKFFKQKTGLLPKEFAARLLNTVSVAK